MISKSDWDDAHRRLMTEGRERFEPPDPDDIEALFRGDLPDAEAERVREALAYYPELVDAMTLPFEENVEGVLTAEEREADLAKIRTRVQQIQVPQTPEPPVPPLPFPERRQPARILAVAAGLVIAVAIGGLVFRRAQSERTVSTRILYADGDRGGGTRGLPAQPPIELSASTDYILKPVFRPERSYREYRFELVDVDAASPRTVWSRTGVQRQPDGSYPIELSTEKLEAGRYELVLYGLDGQAERLATYTLRLNVP